MKSFDLCAGNYEEEFNLTSSLVTINSLIYIAPIAAKRGIVNTISELTKDPSEDDKEVIACLQEVGKLIVEKHNKEAGVKMSACVTEQRAKSRAAFFSCARQCAEFRRE